jgi:hypothetical protein
MGKKAIILMLSVSALFVSSCRKAGCIDMDATNYSASAKKSDGSCTYAESLIFWQDQASAQSWSGIATNLYYYVDGQLVGSSAANVYFTGTPSCSQNGLTSALIDMGKNKSKSINVKVVDDTGFEWWNEYVIVSAGACNYYQVF